MEEKSGKESKKKKEKKELAVEDIFAEKMKILNQKLL